jgi:cytochrome b561
MAQTTHPTRRTRYTLVAITLHWLIALGILALIVIGLVMTQLQIPQMLEFQLFQLHKSIGITVLLLAVLRLLWRFTHRPPPLPAHTPPLEKGAAHGLHWILYFFMFAMPLTGWAVVSASPFSLPTVLYSILPWPDLPYLGDLANKAAVDKVLAWIHAYGSWTLIALLAIHIAAVLRHHLFQGEPILRRMLPGRGMPSRD